MHDISVRDLREAVGGRLVGGGEADVRITGVSTDTRSLKAGDVFFAS